MRREVLRMERVTQMREGVTTLNSFSLNLFAGEVLGLVCVDTVGREDLIQLICQNLPLHYGRVYYGGRLVNSYRHSDASQNHVAVIDRAGRLVDDLSVADNIFVLRRGFKKYIIQPAVLASQLEQFSRETGLSIDASQLVGSLGMFEKCVVELLKAVVTGAKLIVVQDISNIVSAADLSRFQRLLHHYAAKGHAVLYLCSHHEECFAVCDRVALMENGQVLRLMEKGEYDEGLVWAYTLDFGRLEARAGEVPGEAALRFDKVCAGAVQNLSFSVQPGECTVLLDVNNNTFGDILRLLNREARPHSGQILLQGAPLATGRRGRGQVAFVQESPTKNMLYTEMSYLDNLCFLAGEKSPRLWLRPILRKSVLREYEALLGPVIHETDIRGLPPEALYNLVYYRVHLANPVLAVCVQPFFGADMYLRFHILRLIDALRKKGIAVLLLCVNLSDSLLVADRLLLVENGGLAGEYHSEEFSRFSRAQGYPTG